MRSVYPYILFFLIGFLSFSFISSYISINILHLPLAMPEITFLPLLLLGRKYIFPLKLDKKTFLLYVFLLIYLAILALIWNIFDFSSIISSIRGLLYLGLFFCVFKEDNKHITNDYCCVVAVGSIAGWALSCLLNVQYAINVSNDEAQIAIYGTMMAFPLFFAFGMKNIRTFLIGLFFVIIVSMFSGIRRQLLVVAVCLFMGLILQKRSRKNNVVIIAGFASIAVLGKVFFNKIENFLRDNFFALYYRVFIRTKDSLNGGINSDSDVSRFNDIISIFNRDDIYLPHGIASIQTTKYVFTGDFNDYPFYFLSYMLTVFVAIFIVIWLIHFFIKSLKLTLIYKTPEALFATMTFFIAIMLLFVEATYIYYPFSVPVTGLCIGRSYLYCKSKKNLN